MLFVMSVITGVEFFTLGLFGCWWVVGGFDGCFSLGMVVFVVCCLIVVDWLVFYNLVLWFAYYYMLLDWMCCFCFDVWCLVCVVVCCVG